jgi:hypothetical protein
MRNVGLDVLVVRADIADVREGEADHLPGEGGIGHHLLVAGHCGVEAELGDLRPFGPESLAPDHPPIGKDESAGRSLRHGNGRRTGHRGEGSLK